VLLFSLFLLALVPVHAETDSPVVVKWLTTRNQIAVIHAHTLHIYTPDLQSVESFTLIEDTDPDIFIRNALWSRDEKRLAVLVEFPSRSELQIWDMVQHQRLSLIDRHPGGYVGDIDIRAFTWSPDAQQLAISTIRPADAQSMVRFFNANTGAWIRDILLDSYDPSFMAWYYPNEMLLSRYDLEAWSLAEETPLLRQTVGISIGYPARYSPSGGAFAFRVYLDEEDKDTIIEIRNAADFNLLHRLEHNKRVIGYTWSPGGIASVDAGGITRIWKADSGSLMDSFETGRLNWVELSPDGRQLLTLTPIGEIIIRDAVTGEILARLCREGTNAAATPTAEPSQAELAAQALPLFQQIAAERCSGG
jgi:WD40 repeat protein